MVQLATSSPGRAGSNRSRRFRLSITRRAARARWVISSPLMAEMNILICYLDPLRNTRSIS
jgi:hypothetical protein